MDNSQKNQKTILNVDKKKIIGFIPAALIYACIIALHIRYFYQEIGTLLIFLSEFFFVISCFLMVTKYKNRVLVILERCLLPTVWGASLFGLGTNPFIFGAVIFVGLLLYLIGALLHYRSHKDKEHVLSESLFIGQTVSFPIFIIGAIIHCVMNL